MKAKSFLLDHQATAKRTSQVVLAGLLAVTLIGCSGSSDSGVDVATYKGNYAVALVNPLSGQTNTGTMTIQPTGAATIVMDTPWAALSGSVNTNGQITITGNKIGNVYQGDDTWTGQITGEGTGKQVSNGQYKYQYESNPAATSTWTAQCRTGC